MMFFKERKFLEAEFQKWAEENSAACSVFNALTWLVEVKGYRHPEPPKEKLICAIAIDGEEILRKALEEMEVDGKTLAEWLELAKGYEQLKAELADAKRNHQHTIDIAIKQKDQIGRLKKLVVRLSKEKKAAIRDCSEFPCNTCKENNPHFYSPFCRDCIKAGSSRRTNHEWRGVCPENTGVQVDGQTV